MPSPSAPRGPALVRELSALLARWHLWAALAAVGAVQAALLHSAAPLEGARPALLYGLAAAWMGALPVVVSCGAALDRGANLALLLQLGHGPARIVFAKGCAALAGAALLTLPTAAAAALLTLRGAAVTLPLASLLVLCCGAALATAMALVIAALVGDAGYTALTSLLGALAWRWLDGSGNALDLLLAVRTGVVPRATVVELVVAALAVWSLAAVWCSPTASGERRTVRSAITLAVGAALVAAASQLPGSIGSAAELDVRARAAEAAALGELGVAAGAMGAVFAMVGLVLAWRRRT